MLYTSIQHRSNHVANNMLTIKTTFACPVYPLTRPLLHQIVCLSLPLMLMFPPRPVPPTLTRPRLPLIMCSRPTHAHVPHLSPPLRLPHLPLPPHPQVLLIRSGGLDLSMFTPSMKALIKHVMGMGPLRQHGEAGGGEGEGEASPDRAAPFAPVVVDTSHLARQVSMRMGYAWESRRSDGLAGCGSRGQG